MTDRMRKAVALAVLEEELAEADWDSSSAFTVRDGARSGTKNLEWWHEKTPENERSDTQRNLAYLRAYARIGGERMFAGGLFLDRQRLWMDRSVISRLERDQMIAFKGGETSEPWFELTDAGLNWIAKDGNP